MKTKITEMLGIQYPILCGGLFGLSESGLVSSVCNAGGLAFLSSNHLGSKEALREQIKQTKKLTVRPFGVNISLLAESKANRTYDYIDVIIDENIPVVETAGNNPTEFIKLLKSKKIRVIHKAITAKHAVKAEEAGADAVILVGYSAGGHPGMEEVGLFVSLSETVRAVKIPVIAAGGIYTGAGMASAFMMGAEAVLMGTAFMAAKESFLHDNIKERIIQSRSTDTIVLFKSVRNAFRCLKNNEAERILALERNNTPKDELFAHQKAYDAKKAYLSGDADNHLIPVGQAIGLIDKVLSCEELILNMMGGYEKSIKRLERMEGGYSGNTASM